MSAKTQQARTFRGHFRVMGAISIEQAKVVQSKISSELATLQPEGDYTTALFSQRGELAIRVQSSNAEAVDKIAADLDGVTIVIEPYPGPVVAFAADA